MIRNLVVTGIYALALAASSAAVAAERPSWDFVSIALNVTGDFSQGSSNTDNLRGQQLDVSKSLGDLVFLRAVSTDQHVAVNPVDGDVSAHQYGVGFRFGVTSGTDIWTSINYERLSLEGLVGSGYGLDVGIRSQVLSRLELGLTVKPTSHIDFRAPGTGNYTGYEVSAAIEVARNISVLISYANRKVDLDNNGPTLEFNNQAKLGVRLGF